MVLSWLSIHRAWFGAEPVAVVILVQESVRLLRIGILAAPG